MVKNEVFLEGQSKAIQGDLLDTWRFREKHDIAFQLEVELKLSYRQAIAQCAL